MELSNKKKSEKKNFWLFNGTSLFLSQSVLKLPLVPFRKPGLLSQLLDVVEGSAYIQAIASKAGGIMNLYR
jgi:hypothetical protein